MKKKLANVLLIVSAVGGFSHQALADPSTYPDRPIKVVIPQAPGGGTDIVGRLWASWVSKEIGGNVIVENRPGANGVIAASYVKQQKNDGYTLLVAGVSQLAFNASMYKNLPYDVLNDFDGVALLANTPLMLVSSKASGLTDFGKFVAYGQANPGKLTYATAGNGNSTHLAMAMLSKRLDLSMTHIPYNGSTAGLNSVVGAQTDVMFDVLNTAAVQAKAGKVNALVILGNKQEADLPDVPTIADVGLKDFPLPGWYGMVAPKNTPERIRVKLNDATQKFFADPEIAARLRELKMEPLPSQPTDVLAWAQRDAKVWGPLITELGIANEVK
ncbi:tripartite tricarboxylate transporter substrate binding protein [Achromobacter sp.]|uniref:Bug family tripartite tricarboxylate transporter substrate binding protein n=1 Tax=Achromobacter sp. TaxID=134375 RepID=UPI0028AEFBBA|nr:tripartite tricarboxylate transporter substrate binding protein [Achromobacter sp.]